jgi:hypothetical protein
MADPVLTENAAVGVGHRARQASPVKTETVCVAAPQAAVMPRGTARLVQAQAPVDRPAAYA